MGAAASVGTPSQKEQKTDENDDKLFPAGKMFVYFGSQTGTAEGFAKVIEKEGISRGFNAKRVDLEDFDPTQLAESRLAVFLMATYGEGEHTDNATTFHNWMKNDNGEVRENVLKDIAFTVFGLGNRQYEQFNQMGKRTNEAMQICGAKRVFEYGEGDDDGSLEDDFERWRTSMWPTLMSKFHPDAATAATGDNEEKKIIPTYDLIPVTPVTPRPSTANAVSHKPFFIAKQASVGVNRELRNVSDDNSKKVGSTRHIEIELAGTGLTYSTADNLAVLPENDSISVLALAGAQGYPLDESYYMNHKDGDKGKDDFPSPFTARDVLTRFLDINGIPSIITLTQLIPYVTKPAQKEGLRKLLSKDNRAKLHKTIEAGGRSVCELLSAGGDLSSCKIPLQDLMHIIPHIQPRYYTISSSSSCFPDTIHITVSVTEFGSVVRRKGLCSGYLQGLEANGKSTCRVFVRPSTFKLPIELSTPIIMIGPGTGVAPMRGLLQERKFQGLQGKNTLYFGCKNRDEDYLYKSEMEAHVEGKALSNLHLAFSREQKEKLYVQHLIGASEQAKELVTDLDANGHIYVCGATAMGADVMEKIIEVISTHKSMTKTVAQEYVKSLQASGRYVTELWSTG
eukprot:CAMPEP_0119042436 /NCGR_PEP_ID=MMETSP1177-20130426/15177_1 /TAXON_ID=2985 /ORGANISM="Ochromonas sp, Strain CCMP1899" /LENGTH=623 /DNA_ID=CAMNT_0007009233 /DNA_START=235 /DNA_END=2106 /DNA_ORIENTATION=-